MHVPCQTRVGFLPAVHWITRSGCGCLRGAGLAADRQRLGRSGGSLRGRSGALDRSPVSDVFGDDEPLALRAEGFLGARGVLTARGTRRKYVHVGSVAASMPPHGPAIGEATAPESLKVAFLKLVHSSACIERIIGCAVIQAIHVRHCLHHARRPSRQVLARPPSRDLTRHGCRVRAYMDVLAACPARVGGQGPCSQGTNQRSAANAQINSIANRTHLADKPSLVSVNRVRTTCETAGVKRHVALLASHVPRAAASKVLGSAASQSAVRQWASVALSR
ncbi:UNVERIFIED_ORG: hypothetical protein FHR63_000163 [Xanthomonas campestris]